MLDSKRIEISGSAIPLRGNDIDTDRIIPARYLRTVTFDGLGEHAFEDDRRALKAEGKLHVLDDAKHASGRILLVNKNFGCGSSREHAPQAIMRFGKGIAAIVGESFAEIFYGNCMMLGVPCAVVGASQMAELMAAVEANPELTLSVDVRTRTVSAGKLSVPFEMPEGARAQFLEGNWDTTGELLSGQAEIRATAAKLPYFSDFG